jgi:hypothetical protein
MFFKNIEKKILFRSLEEKTEIQNKLDSIVIHSVIDLNFLDQFLLYIFLDEESKYIILRIYKKSYNEVEKIWEKDDLLFLTSWKLNFNSTEDNIYNVDNIENKKFIEDNNIELDSIDLHTYYPFDILEKDYQFYNENKYIRVTIDEDFEQQTLESSWGYETNYKDIRWMFNLENIINSTYGADIEILHKLRCSSFKKSNFIKCYYKNFDFNSLVYQKINSSVSFSYDLCKNKLDDLEKAEIWHNPTFGDLCNYCMGEKKIKEIFRKNYLRKKMLNEGKKKVFEKELIKTKLYLVNNKIHELSLENKDSFIKKILINTVNIINRNSCSICLETMDKDIFVGQCGHCFHENCVLSLQEEKCPLCRKYTQFTKLFLE